MTPAQIVEALLFSSDAPLTASDLARADEGLDEDVVDAAVQQLREQYEATDRAFQIYELAGGYQVLTRPEYSPYLERFETVPQPSRLSQPALEVLAIIAYRQPIGRAEIEEIRGVGSSGVLRTLQDRGLIDVVGRGEGLGRPLLYGTSDRFLEHLGFRSLEDLPRAEDLPVVLRERVRAAEELEAGAGAPAEDSERAAAASPAAPAAPTAGEKPRASADSGSQDAGGEGSGAGDEPVADRAAADAG